MSPTKEKDNDDKFTPTPPQSQPQPPPLLNAYHYPQMYPGPVYPHPNGYPPYTVPPPAIYYTPQASPPQTGSAILYQRLVCIVVIFVILIIFSNFILLFIMVPTLPSFRVNSLSMSNLTIINAHLNADWDIGFNIGNPSKKVDMRFEHIQAAVLYRETILSQSLYGPFRVERKNGTSFHINLRTEPDQLIDDSLIAPDISMERTKMFVNFNVRLLVPMRYETEKWSTGTQFLKVTCDDLDVRFSNVTGKGNFANLPTQCAVFL